MSSLLNLPLTKLKKDLICVNRKLRNYDKNTCKLLKDVDEDQHIDLFVRHVGLRPIRHIDTPSAEEFIYGIITYGIYKAIDVAKKNIKLYNIRVKNIGSIFEKDACFFDIESESSEVNVSFKLVREFSKITGTHFHIFEYEKGKLRSIYRNLDIYINKCEGEDYKLVSNDDVNIEIESMEETITSPLLPQTNSQGGGKIQFKIKRIKKIKKISTTDKNKNNNNYTAKTKINKNK